MRKVAHCLDTRPIFATFLVQPRSTYLGMYYSQYAGRPYIGCQSSKFPIDMHTDQPDEENYSIEIPSLKEYQDDS